MSFWNEYMTADGPDGQRVGTFPDLIMTFDAQTGRPTPTSDLTTGQDIYLIHVDASRLKLSTTMFDQDLLAEVEGIIHRPIVDCLHFRALPQTARRDPRMPRASPGRAEAQ